MDFDITHPKGDRSIFCSTGTRVRCVMKATTPLQPPSPSNKFTVVSYNTYDTYFLISHDGQRERTCRIPAAISKDLGDADAIVFQGAFNGK